MRKYLSTVILFSISAYLILALLDVGYSRFAAKTNYRSYKYWTYLMEGTIEADVLAMGSSRIVKHFDPAVFDSITGVKSYNIGMDGAHITDMLARYNLFKQRNPLPKVALVNIDYFTLTDNRTKGESQFFPWFIYKRFRKAVSFVRPFSFGQLYIPMYRYDIENFLRTLCERERPLEKGFDPINHPFDEDAVNRSSLVFKANPKFEPYLFQFLDILKEDGVRVVFMFSPWHDDAIAKANTLGQMREYYSKIASERGITLLDYTEMPFSSDTSYFFDAMHLNGRGAAVFTDSLARDLKRLHILDFQ